MVNVMATLYQSLLISYDVQDNRNRRKLATLLKDFGLAPLQKSVFYGYLNQAELRALIHEARQLLNPETDSLFWQQTHLEELLEKHHIGKHPAEPHHPEGYHVL